MAVCPRTTVKVVLVRPLLEVVALPGWGVVVVTPQLGSCCWPPVWGAVVVALARNKKKSVVYIYIYKQRKNRRFLSGMANGDLKVLSPVGLDG